ncbi:hypothetical protein [Shewanella baltica]|uniref:hypothetical protein n=1 Tax=Shewanella baltica TaxID=62322 RepID=UPI00217CCBC1|nr:hypothetical protein [Shewanella baltica]MCS6158390.1 hypothetical protein [Shewanella baltica]
MDSDYIAYLALIVSVGALIVSFLALVRDKYSLKVHGSIFGNQATGWNYSISVVNVGRRPITVTHVEYKTQDGSHYSCPFNIEKQCSEFIDVGQIFTTAFHGKDGRGFFDTLERVKSTSFYIHDAFGVVYKVNKPSTLVKLKNAVRHLFGTRK